MRERIDLLYYLQGSPLNWGKKERFKNILPDHRILRKIFSHSEIIDGKLKIQGPRDPRLNIH